MRNNKMSVFIQAIHGTVLGVSFFLVFSSEYKDYLVSDKFSGCVQHNDSFVKRTIPYYFRYPNSASPSQFSFKVSLLPWLDSCRNMSTVFQANWQHNPGVFTVANVFVMLYIDLL